MNLTALQTPLEAPPQAARAAPAIVLPGNVLVYAVRDGDRITGRVEFPYEVGGRTSVPIDYINAGPLPKDISPATLDAKGSARLKLVQKLRDICVMVPDVPRREHARRVASEATIKCSVRSLQLWASKLDAEGPLALCDRYTPAPRKALSLDSKRATDAVSVCAWWAFRIGNVEKIDAPMMHHADQALRRALRQADILAAIDCYYAWDTDRVKFPFKPFARWCRYDTETWIGRANDKNDYRSRLPEDRTPLLAGDETDHTFSGVPNPKERRRDVNHRPTRRAIDDMKESPNPEAVGDSIHESIMALDEPQRRMLFAAARNDSNARSQAVSTMPLWWDHMPESVRNNILVRIGAWQATQRRHPTDLQFRSRKFMLFLAELRRERREFNRLPAQLGVTI